MALDNINPANWNFNLNAGGIFGTIVNWASIFSYAIVIMIIVWMVLRYFQYRIPVEVYERRGLTAIIIGTKKAKKVVKDALEHYELLDNFMGTIFKKFRKEFRVDDNKFIFATTKGISFKLERVGETYQPIRITNPEIALERVPQNLLWWLSSKIVAIKEKYSDHKWWEPYIMHFSMIVVAIICLLMVILTLDKVSGIQEFCSKAEQSLASKLTQTIK